MSAESKNPEEVLRFWRDMKDAIASNCNPGDVFEVSEIVESALDTYETELREAIDAMKKPGDFVLNLSCFEGLAEGWAKDNGYVKE